MVTLSAVEATLVLPADRVGRGEAVDAIGQGKP